MFKGYCFMEDGSHTEAIKLNSPEEAVRYALLQMGVQHEVRVCDEDDYIVIHTKDGNVLYPEILKEEISKGVYHA